MISEAPKRILIVKLSAIGDVLMATPVAHALRTAFPQSHIAWVVEGKSADVVRGNPCLDEVIIFGRTKSGHVFNDASNFLRGVVSIRRELKSGKFDACIDLQGRLRSAFVCLLSGAKRRIGASDATEHSQLLYTDKYEPRPDVTNIQQRNLDLLKPLGVDSTETAMHMPVCEDDREFADRYFQDHNLGKEKVVALCVATTWRSKHWTPEGWTAVADILWRKYGARSLMLGSKADIPLVQKIADATECKPLIAAGQTTLKQAGAVMEKCVAVIGVDTGLLHMAVALDRPTVGLFGASDWRDFQKKDNFIWVAKDYPCSPCRRRPTCSDIDCMKSITPEDVEVAARPWLES